ncbi:GntR family transcriptional regulator [Anaerolineales bacterium HSG25]|nr:GntR family transcriptional regulator [Anaerolineales bacterium HSG25]
MSSFLDKQHPTPVYLQLKEVLQDQIEQGIYSSNQRLPSERHLCQHYNLSRMTARRALQELIAEGLAYTRAGKGTFVSHTSNKIETIVSPPTFDKTCNSQLLQYQSRILDQLSSFRTVAVEKTIKEVLSLYPAEVVVLELFLPLIREAEQRWYRHEISLLIQNYIVTTIRSYLITLVHSAINPDRDKKILLVCAPLDLHEMGSLALAFCLRQRGFAITCLGNHTVADEFYPIIEVVQPKLVCFSAYTNHSAEALITLSQVYHTQHPVQTTNGYQLEKPLLTFGGTIFYQKPRLIQRVSGLYLGNTIEEAIVKIEHLISSVTPTLEVL